MTRNFHSDERKLYFTLKSTQIHLRRHENGLTFFFFFLYLHDAKFHHKVSLLELLSFLAGARGWKAAMSTHMRAMWRGGTQLFPLWRENKHLSDMARERMRQSHDNKGDVNFAWSIHPRASRWKMANSSECKSFRLRHTSHSSLLCDFACELNFISDVKWKTSKFRSSSSLSSLFVHIHFLLLFEAFKWQEKYENYISNSNFGSNSSPAQHSTSRSSTPGSP